MIDGFIDWTLDLPPSMVGLVFGFGAAVFAFVAFFVIMGLIYVAAGEPFANAWPGASGTAIGCGLPNGIMAWLRAR